MKRKLVSDNNDELQDEVSKLNNQVELLTEKIDELIKTQKNNLKH